MSPASLSFADFDRRAVAGEALTIAFLGGSLTWGANATDPERFSYRARVRDFLRLESLCVAGPGACIRS